jgi:uncharacterized protein DUF3618
MVPPSTRGPEQVRRDIEAHREELAGAVDALKRDIGEATNIGGKLRANLPAVAGAAAAAGFLLTGGIGATMRLLARRGREGREKARVGRFSLVDRD